MIKADLDKLMLKYKVQPVGDGYIDCITKLENVREFVACLTESGIRVTSVTWWCDCTDENKDHDGNPHGYGGPTSHYYDGWFSEMPWCFPYDHDFADNTEALKFIFTDFPKTEYYLPCLVPGLWLGVPDDWRSINLRESWESQKFIKD